MAHDSDGNTFTPQSVERARHVDYDSERANASHVSYPHLPGYLYDCPACESRCYCGNIEALPACCGIPARSTGACHTECVHCATISEMGEW